MAREVTHRCDRCLLVYDPKQNALTAGDRFEVFAPALDGHMDLCANCEAELDAWVRAPLEDDTDVIDHTTGQPA